MLSESRPANGSICKWILSGLSLVVFLVFMVAYTDLDVPHTNMASQTSNEAPQTCMSQNEKTSTVNKLVVAFQKLALDRPKSYDMHMAMRSFFHPSALFVTPSGTFLSSMLPSPSYLHLFDPTSASAAQDSSLFDVSLHGDGGSSALFSVDDHCLVTQMKIMTPSQDEPISMDKDTKMRQCGRTLQAKAKKFQPNDWGQTQVYHIQNDEKSVVHVNLYSMLRHPKKVSLVNNELHRIVDEFVETDLESDVRNVYRGWTKKDLLWMTSKKDLVHVDADECVVRNVLVHGDSTCPPSNAPIYCEKKNQQDCQANAQFCSWKPGHSTGHYCRHKNPASLGICANCDPCPGLLSWQCNNWLWDKDKVCEWVQFSAAGHCVTHSKPACSCFSSSQANCEGANYCEWQCKGCTSANVVLGDPVDGSVKCDEQKTKSSCENRNTCYWNDATKCILPLRVPNERPVVKCAPPPPPPPPAPWCFPASSKIRVSSDTSIDISHATPTRKIWSPMHGFEDVYLMGHNDANVYIQFVSITTRKLKKTVVASADHYLYMVDETRNGCENMNGCSFEKCAKHARFVDVLNLKEKVSVFVMDESNEIICDRVNGNRTRMVTERGIYAPFSLSGDLIVNDVVVSSHMNYQWHANWIPNEHVARFHQFLHTPLCLLYRIRGGPQYFVEFFKRFPDGPPEYDFVWVVLYILKLVGLGMCDLMGRIPKFLVVQAGVLK